MGNYYKFKIFGVPIGIRIGCLHKRFNSMEAAKSEVENLEQAVNYCPFCNGFHIKKRVPGRRERVFTEQEGLCLRCRKYFGFELTLHHIMPLSKGGRNNRENLQGLCRDCHTKLHQKESPIGKRQIVKRWNIIQRSNPEFTNTIIRDKLIEAGVIGVGFANEEN